jgi:predicted small lipoprotein YifL
MKNFSRLLATSFLATLTACGVKGKPQPPLTPPVLGRGALEPLKTKDESRAKKKIRPVDDWEDSIDFSEEK